MTGLHSNEHILLLYDKAMIMYAAKLEHGTGVVSEDVDGDVIISLEDEGPALLMVLALNSATETRKNLGHSKNLSF